MFVTQFQKAINYIRQAQEMALFATMADVRLAAAFRASPLFYIMLPFIGFLLTINAVINGYKLAKASNQNFDTWFLFVNSVFCATLASISLYGAALSVLFGFSFVAGPWFFFSGLIGGLGQQLVMFGLNLYRTAESPYNSIQRTHYIQAALSNLFVMALLTAAVGAVVFGMLFSVAPMIATVCATSALLLTGIDILWRMTPHNLKQLIKGWFHLDKPDLSQDATAYKNQILNPVNSIDCEEIPQQHRLFTHCDYKAVIRKMDVDEAKNYLEKRILHKLNTFVQEVHLQDEKTKDKTSLLRQLLSEINNPGHIAKTDVLERYPLAFQSFWAEKGDVEQIFDAVVALQDKSEQTNASYSWSK